ncbi:MAG: peptidase S10 [Trueperaceae bacterium]|nr:peptidase S10 [Trueperaceae bacterium]
MTTDPAPTNATDTRTPKDNLVITHHETTIRGKKVSYTATTGTMVLTHEKVGEGEKAGQFEGVKPRAEVFFIAYELDGVKDKSTRPLTFSFNGGPGSSSVWMHLGLFGPKRVELDDDGNPPAPPYRLVPNDESLLDVTDLVFIDPVSTGYSRPVEGVKAKDFHSVDTDVESVGAFIRLYTGRYGRWGSPKFLAGESYGTTRAAGLAGHLQGRHGLYLNGLMLVSSILDFSTARFEAANDLPPLLFLPTYAATAHYHERLAPELQALSVAEFLKQVEEFTLNRYAPALLLGDRLEGAARAAVVAELARYTGLSEAYIESTDLRIEIMRFTKELLRGQGRTAGRLDSRFTGVDRDSAGETFEFDPSMSAIQGPYTATLNDYVRNELGYQSDLPYEILANLYQSWSYKDVENRYLNVAETLRKAMSINPFLKVHVANGYFDLATPYYATLHTFAHMALTPEQRQNVSMSFYEAGHMMYVHRASLLKMREELERFIVGAGGGV